jgi:hypothetical protein
MTTWEVFAVFAPTDEGSKFVTLFRVKEGESSESVRAKVFERFPEGAPVVIVRGTLMVDPTPLERESDRAKA